jgi:adenine-specific DNA methylase
MNKVEKIMKEFKGGDLKSSSGQKVTNPKQAIAIGLSEQRRMKNMAKGGEMKESKAMMKKEVGFMKAKGAPKSMIKHEEAEMKGMNYGGKVKKMAMGGRMASKGEHPVQTKSKRGAEMIKMASGGLASGHKSADGIASKGKTKGKMITMNMGGKC